MGNVQGGPAQIVAYGFTKESTIESLRALLRFEYSAALYVNQEGRYWIHYNYDVRDVKFYTSEHNVFKAVINL